MTGEALTAAVSCILRRPLGHTWTVQGFGMVRTYLDDAKRWRLNVWDDRLMVPNVSVIHDHPWDFRSFVIGGLLRNQRYLLIPSLPEPELAPTHNFVEIITGEEGGLLRPKQTCHLKTYPQQAYGPGQTYRQHREEVHETLYLRGTVTLNDRSAPTPQHTARVFFPLNTEWVDAKPREATIEEIYAATNAALEMLQ